MLVRTRLTLRRVMFALAGLAFALTLAVPVSANQPTDISRTTCAGLRHGHAQVHNMAGLEQADAQFHINLARAGCN